MKNKLVMTGTSTLFVSLIIACAPKVGSGWKAGIPDLTSNPNNIDPSTVVVRSQAVFKILSDGASAAVVSADTLVDRSIISRNQNSSTPVTVINDPSSSMTLDASLFSIPTAITSAIMDFGFLQLTALSDNDLKHCGKNNNQKCGTALIQMYTTGPTGAGLYNSADQYGLPITAGQTTKSVIGLGASNAVVMQSFAIPNNRNTVKLTDFINPKYGVNIDFSDAGAGVYSTTIVVEYALAP